MPPAARGVVTARLVVFAALGLFAAWLLRASVTASGWQRRGVDEVPAQQIAVVQKRVADRQRFEAGQMRGAELSAYQDSLAQAARRDSLAEVRRTRPLRSYASGAYHPDYGRGYQRVGGGPSSGK